MKTRKFYNDRTGEIITFEDVLKLYDKSINNGFTTDSFDHWFELVQSNNNGALTEVFKYSMLIWNRETEQHEHIISIGMNPQKACEEYAILNNYCSYPKCINFEKIDF